MSRFANFNRRVAAATGSLAVRLEKCSRPALARALACAIGLTWLVMVCLVKVRLLAAGVLASDLPYYQNMLYNTGISFSRRSFDFLYSWRELLAHGSNTFLGHSS